MCITLSYDYSYNLHTVLTNIGVAIVLVSVIVRLLMHVVVFLFVASYTDILLMTL